jgi:hypothetical protein
MEQYILTFIDNRMKALGFENYVLETFLVVLNQTLNTQQVTGQNEYFFLVTQTIVEGTEISADNNYFKADILSSATSFWKIQEFTGNISMSVPQGAIQILEFLRVIPQKA